MKEQRKRYYINKPFQRSFVLRFVGFAVLIFVVFEFSLYYSLPRVLETAFTHKEVKVLTFSDFLLPALGALVFLIATIFGSIKAFFFSHKIAGPLYRLEKTARQITAGDLSFNIHLRSKDEMQDLAKAMNDMVSDLRSRVQVIKAETERLKNVVELSKKGDTDPASMISELEDIQSKLEKEIGRFYVGAV